MHAFLSVCFLRLEQHITSCHASEKPCMSRMQELLRGTLGLSLISLLCILRLLFKRGLIVFQAEFDTYWFKRAMANAHTPCIGSCPNPCLWWSFFCLAVIVLWMDFIIIFHMFSSPQPFRRGRFLNAAAPYVSVCFGFDVWRRASEQNGDNGW